MKKLILPLLLILMATAVFAEELVIGVNEDGSTQEFLLDDVGVESIYVIQVFETPVRAEITGVKVLVENVANTDGYFYAMLYDDLIDVGTKLGETDQAFGEAFVTENEWFMLNFSEPYPIVEANTPYFIFYAGATPDIAVYAHMEMTVDYPDGDCYFWDTTDPKAVSCDDYETEYPLTSGSPIDVAMSVFYNEAPEEVRGGSTGSNLAYLSNIQKLQQKEEEKINPLEQLILNIRNAILRLFGHELS